MFFIPEGAAMLGLMKCSLGWRTFFPWLSLQMLFIGCTALVNGLRSHDLNKAERPYLNQSANLLYNIKKSALILTRNKEAKSSDAFNVDYTRDMENRASSAYGSNFSPSKEQRFSLDPCSFAQATTNSQYLDSDYSKSMPCWTVKQRGYLKSKPMKESRILNNKLDYRGNLPSSKQDFETNASQAMEGTKKESRQVSDNNQKFSSLQQEESSVEGSGDKQTESKLSERAINFKSNNMDKRGEILNDDDSYYYVAELVRVPDTDAKDRQVRSLDLAPSQMSYELVLSASKDSNLNLSEDEMNKPFLETFDKHQDLLKSQTTAAISSKPKEVFREARALVEDSITGEDGIELEDTTTTEGNHAKDKEVRHLISTFSSPAQKEETLGAKEDVNTGLTETFGTSVAEHGIGNQPPSTDDTETNVSKGRLSGIGISESRNKENGSRITPFSVTHQFRRYAENSLWVTEGSALSPFMHENHMDPEKTYERMDLRLKRTAGESPNPAIVDKAGSRSSTETEHRSTSMHSEQEGKISNEKLPGDASKLEKIENILLDKMELPNKEKSKIIAGFKTALLLSGFIKPREDYEKEILQKIQAKSNNLFSGDKKVQKFSNQTTTNATTVEERPLLSKNVSHIERMQEGQNEKKDMLPTHPSNDEAKNQSRIKGFVIHTVLRNGSLEDENKTVHHQVTQQYNPTEKNNTENKTTLTSNPLSTPLAGKGVTIQSPPSIPVFQNSTLASSVINSGAEMQNLSPLNKLMIRSLEKIAESLARISDAPPSSSISVVGYVPQKTTTDAGTRRNTLQKSGKKHAIVSLLEQEISKDGNNDGNEILGWEDRLLSSRAKHLYRTLVRPFLAQARETYRKIRKGESEYSKEISVSNKTKEETLRLFFGKPRPAHMEENTVKGSNATMPRMNVPGNYASFDRQTVGSSHLVADLNHGIIELNNIIGDSNHVKVNSNNIAADSNRAKVNSNNIVTDSNRAKVNSNSMADWHHIKVNSNKERESSRKYTSAMAVRKELSESGDGPSVKTEGGQFMEVNLKNGTRVQAAGRTKAAPQGAGYLFQYPMPKANRSMFVVNTLNGTQSSSMNIITVEDVKKHQEADDKSKSRRRYNFDKAVLAMNNYPKHHMSYPGVLSPGMKPEKKSVFDAFQNSVAQFTGTLNPKKLNNFQENSTSIIGAASMKKTYLTPLGQTVDKLIRRIEAERSKTKMLDRDLPTASKSNATTLITEHASNESAKASPVPALEIGKNLSRTEIEIKENDAEKRKEVPWIKVQRELSSFVKAIQRSAKHKLSKSVGSQELISSANLKTIEHKKPAALGEHAGLAKGNGSRIRSKETDEQNGSGLAPWTHKSRHGYSASRLQGIGNDNEEEESEERNAGLKGEKSSKTSTSYDRVGVHFQLLPAQGRNYSNSKDSLAMKTRIQTNGKVLEMEQKVFGKGNTTDAMKANKSAALMKTLPLESFHSKLVQSKDENKWNRSDTHSANHRRRNLRKGRQGKSKLVSKTEMAAYHGLLSEQSSKTASSGLRNHASRLLLPAPGYPLNRRLPGMYAFRPLPNPRQYMKIPFYYQNFFHWNQQALKKPFIRKTSSSSETNPQAKTYSSALSTTVTELMKEKSNGSSDKTAPQGEGHQGSSNEVVENEVPLNSSLKLGSRSGTEVRSKEFKTERQVGNGQKAKPVFEPHSVANNEASEFKTVHSKGAKTLSKEKQAKESYRHRPHSVNSARHTADFRSQDDMVNKERLIKALMDMRSILQRFKNPHMNVTLKSTSPKPKGLRRKRKKKKKQGTEKQVKNGLQGKSEGQDLHRENLDRIHNGNSIISDVPGSNFSFQAHNIDSTSSLEHQISYKLAKSPENFPAKYTEWSKPEDQISKTEAFHDDNSETNDLSVKSNDQIGLKNATSGELQAEEWTSGNDRNAKGTGYDWASENDGKAEYVMTQQWRKEDFSGEEVVPDESMMINKGKVSDESVVPNSDTQDQALQATPFSGPRSMHVESPVTAEIPTWIPIAPIPLPVLKKHTKSHDKKRKEKVGENGEMEEVPVSPKQENALDESKNSKVVQDEDPGETIKEKEKLRSKFGDKLNFDALEATEPQKHLRTSWQEKMELDWEKKSKEHEGTKTTLWQEAMAKDWQRKEAKHHHKTTHRVSQSDAEVPVVVKVTEDSETPHAQVPAIDHKLMQYNVNESLGETDVKEGEEIKPQLIYTPIDQPPLVNTAAHQTENEAEKQQSLENETPAPTTTPPTVTTRAPLYFKGNRTLLNHHQVVAVDVSPLEKIYFDLHNTSLAEEVHHKDNETIATNKTTTSLNSEKYDIEDEVNVLEGRPEAFYRVKAAKYFGAVCLDGSIPGYYYRPGSGSGKKKWVVHLHGGAWCYNLKTCLKRRDSILGSTKHWYRENIDIFFRGFLSNNATINPEFYNWNIVVQSYCDGGLFSGNRERPLIYKGRKLYFRGRRILRAMIHDLNRKGLSQATDLIISGTSAGGLAVVLQGDFIRKHMPSKMKVRGLVDAGFFLDAPTTQKSSVIRDQFKGVVSLHRPKLNHRCLKAHDKAQRYMCVFPQYVLKYVKLPLFFVNALYDHWQISELQRLPCIYDNVHCTSDERDKILKFRNIMYSVISQTLRNVQHSGVFANSCIAHGQVILDYTWTKVRVRNTTIAGSFSRWYEDDKRDQRYFYTDCRYPCNGSCPRLMAHACVSNFKQSSPFSRFKRNAELC